MSTKTMSDQMILRSKDCPPTNPYKTVGEYFWKRLAQLEDDFVCVIDARTDERLTIGSLKSRSNSLAVALLKRGVTKSDVITFYGSNTIEHTVLRFVAYFLGLTFIPLSSTFEKYEVQQEYKSAGANIIISSARDLHKFEEIIKNPVINKLKLVVVFDEKHEKFVTFDQLLKEGRDQSLERIPHFDINTETDMLCLLHTSGTTGSPKCVMLPHKITLIDGMSLELRSDVKGSIIGSTFSFGHIGGTLKIPFDIICGATVILFGDFNEELLWKSVYKYKVSTLVLRPNIGRRLVEGDLAQKYDLSSLRAIAITGGSFLGNIAQELINKYGVKFIEIYAMTECSRITRGAEPDDPFISGNIGRVVPGIEVKFVDLTTGEAVGPNIDGEICVRGSKMFCGYLKEGVVSREAFDSEGWYRTGDIGHYDEKERIFIKDRIKEIIRIGNENLYTNISPVEVELFLLTHESITDVVVVGVNNKTGTQWPRAYVVLKEGKTTTEQNIQEFVSDTLAYTKQLKAGVIFVDSIHRTHTGKVDRKFYRNLVMNEVIE